MAIAIYKSTDASAPVLGSAAAGGMVALLDACLINGYGANAAAGWTKPFSGTNQAVYQAPSGNRRYCMVDDTSATMTYFRMFESMTAVTTGTNGTPTNTNAITKPSSTYQYWELVVSPTTFYLYVWSTSSAPFDPIRKGSNCYGSLMGFGDGLPFNGSDAYCTFLFGSPNSTQVVTQPSAVLTSHYLVRPCSQIGTAIQCGKYVAGAPGGATYLGNGTAMFQYPNPADGSVMYAPVWLTEPIAGSGGARGVMPGIWGPLHNQPLNTGDEFTHGTRTLRCWNVQVSGQVLIEISDTWGT